MLPLSMLFLTIFLGVGIGFVASLFGIGGGFLLVPAMILIMGMGIHNTVGTVAFVILFISLSSSIAYMRQKRIDYLIVLILGGGSVAGSVLGANITVLVPGPLILVLFGCIQIPLAIILGVKKTPEEKNKKNDKNNENNTESNNSTIQKKWYIISRLQTDKDGNVYKYRANMLLAFPFIVMAGFLSSFLGIGGGTLYVQIFVFICGMSIHMAIASSMFAIFLTTIGSSITFAALGQIDYIVGIGFAIGTILGAQIGAIVSKKIKSNILKKLAAIMILVIAIRMIIFALLQNPA